MRRILLVCLLFLPLRAWAEPCDSGGAGTANWSAVTWANCAEGTEDTFTILSGDVITLDTDTTAQANSGITINSGGTLVMATDNSVVTGNFDCDGTLTQPSSAGAAELEVSGNFDIRGCTLNNAGNLDIDLTGTGNFDYDTTSGGFAFHDIRWAYTGQTTTLRDFHGDTIGQDIESNGVAIHMGGTLAMDETQCAGGSCTWPPTLEVRSLTNGEVAYSGSGTFNIERLEIEFTPDFGVVSVDFDEITFGAEFATFDFTAQTGTTAGDANRGKLQFGGDADFNTANIHVEKNGTVYQNRYTVQTTGELRVGTGTEGNSSTWLVMDGKLLAGDAFLGQANSPGHLHAGRGYVELTSLTLDDAGSSISGWEGGRIFITGATPTVAGATWYASPLLGVDTNTGAEKTQGATGPEATMAACIGDIAGATDGCFLRSGEVFDNTGGDVTVNVGQGDMGIWSDAVAYTNYPEGWGPDHSIHFDAGDSFIDNTTGEFTIHRSDWRWGTGLHAEIQIKELGQTVSAPYAMHFSGHKSYRGGFTRSHDFRHLQYHWRVHENSTETWARGALANTAANAQLKVEGFGPIFGYLFKNAGSFRVELLVTDGTQWARDEVVVVVEDTEVAWPPGGSTTKCFADTTDNGGNFLGCPNDTNGNGTCDTGTCADEDNFNTILTTHGCGSTNGIRCLFRRGDTFEVTSDPGIDTDNSYYGAFGTGARPIIHSTGAQGFDVCALNTRLISLHIDGDGVDGADGLNADCQQDRLLLWDVKFSGWESSLSMTINASAAVNLGEEDIPLSNGVHDRISVIESDISEGGSPTDAGGVDLFIEGSNLLIMGNLIGNKTIGHCKGGQACNGGTDDGANCNTACEDGGGTCSGGTCSGGTENGNSCDTICEDGGGTCQNRLDPDTQSCTQDSNCDLFSASDGLGSCLMEEHNFRSKFQNGMYAGHNDIGYHNPTLGTGCGQIRAVTTLRSGTSQNLESGGDRVWRGISRFTVVQDNDFQACSRNNVVLTIQATSTGNDAEAHYNYIVEGNMFQSTNRVANATLDRDGGAESTLLQLHNTFDTTVRNNVFNCARTGGTTNNQCTVMDFSVRGSDTPNHPCMRNEAYNNSAWLPSTGAGDEQRVIQIHSSQSDTVVANLYAFDDADGAGQADLVSDSGTRTDFCLIGGSEVEGDCNTLVTNGTDPFASHAALATFDDFNVASGVNGSDLGTKVALDFYHGCREHVTNYFRGAHQNDASACFDNVILAQNTDNTNSSVGMNVHKVRYRESAVPFVNAMKVSHDWERDTTTPCSSSAEGYGRDSGNTTWGPNAQGEMVSGDGYPFELGNNGADFCVFTEIYDNNAAISEWPQGVWKIMYDGDSTVVVGDSASDLEADSDPGPDSSHEFDVAGTGGGIIIGFTALDPQDPLGNVRVYPPGGVCAKSADPPYGLEPWSYCDAGGVAGDYPDLTDTTGTVTCTGDYSVCVPLADAAENGGLVFHPRWVANLTQMRAVRMMDWFHTNSSSIAEEWHWTKATNRTYDTNQHHWRPDGFTDPGAVPPEIAADLCRTIDSECWFNVPHQATDTEITRMAKILRDRIGQDAYLEYSNEVWNTGLGTQDDYVLDQANADYAGCNTGDTFPEQRVCRNSWFAVRTGEMCDLAQTVFDETNESARLICVMGSRAEPGNDGQEFEDRLDCVEAPETPCYSNAIFNNIDAWASAPYSNPADTCTTDGSAANVCSAVRNDPVGTDARYNDPSNHILDHFALLNGGVPDRDLTWFGLTYEAGPSLDEPSDTVCLAATQDACMEVEVEYMLDSWEDHFTTGGRDVRLWNAFNYHSTYTATGSGIENLFGFCEDWYCDSDPKYKAITDFQGLTSCWWTDCELRGGAAPAAPTPGVGGGGSMSISEGDSDETCPGSGPVPCHLGGRAGGE